jgi:hypothetical protein
VLSRHASVPCCSSSIGEYEPNVVAEVGVNPSESSSLSPIPTRRHLLLGTLGLTACSRVEAPAAFLQPADRAPAEIVVTRRSWHTDVCFPAVDLPAPIDTVAERFPGVAWFAVGFGDRAWLIDNARGPLAALGALGGSPAALLFTALSAPPEVGFARYDNQRMRLPPAGLAAIKAFIAEQLESAEPIARGPYAGSLFYTTRLRYSAVYTCNTWTADALRAGGLGVDPTGIAFADQVMAAARAAALRS